LARSGCAGDRQREVRELFIYEYRLIYEIDGKIVRIIAVIHG
jgi:hypothetical protein